MKTDAIIISVLYMHFFKMQQRGRKVTPWFQTVAVLSFLIIVLCVLLCLIALQLLYSGHYEVKTKEIYFLNGFILSITLVFTLIKKHYFNTNKHLLYLDKFNSLTIDKQKKYNFLILSIAALLPFGLLFVVYLLDSRR